MNEGESIFPMKVRVKEGREHAHRGGTALAGFVSPGQIRWCAVMFDDGDRPECFLPSELEEQRIDWVAME